MTRYSFNQTPVGPDQALSFTEALRAHTIEGAYAGHQDQVLGSIEAGKFADLVVWKNDPSQLTVKDLALTTTVDMTFVDGKIVYQS